MEGQDASACLLGKQRALALSGARKQRAGRKQGPGMLRPDAALGGQRTPLRAGENVTGGGRGEEAGADSSWNLPPKFTVLNQDTLMAPRSFLPSSLPRRPVKGLSRPLRSPCWSATAPLVHLSFAASQQDSQRSRFVLSGVAACRPHCRGGNAGRWRRISAWCRPTKIGV